MASPEEYQWAYSIMDSSRVSTFLISILLIVYGSFRSLNMEEEAREREKEKEHNKQLSGLTNGQSRTEGIQTLDTIQALCLPLGASVSLLVMFFFFDSMQMLFAICTAIIATVALAFLLLPMCQYIIRPCSDGNKISFGICGRFTGAELLSFSLAVFIVCIWVLTGHWILMDAMGMGLCVAFIAFVRLPSLKVSTLLLTGLLIYDVFWVFFSSYIFNANVMVKVATRPAENPVGMVARRLHLGGVVKDAPKLSLPGKLVFPSMNHAGHFSMLGLGDIVMPGLLLCFVLRYDAYKKSQLSHLGELGVPPPKHLSNITYFHCSLLGYFLGLVTATVSSEVFKAAQPALLYLVPFTLLPLLTMAYLKLWIGSPRDLTGKFKNICEAFCGSCHSNTTGNATYAYPPLLREATGYVELKFLYPLNPWGDHTESSLEGAAGIHWEGTLRQPPSDGTTIAVVSI